MGHNILENGRIKMYKVNKYYVFLTNCFDNLFCQKHLQYLPNLFLIMWITVGHQCPTVWCTANGQCCTYTEKYTWTSVTWFRKCWDSSSAVLKIGCCLLILIFHVIFPFSVSIRMYCTVNPAAGQRFLCKHGLIKKQSLHHKIINLLVDRPPKHSSILSKTNFFLPLFGSRYCDCAYVLYISWC